MLILGRTTWYSEKKLSGTQNTLASLALGSIVGLHALSNQVLDMRCAGNIAIWRTVLVVIKGALDACTELVITNPNVVTRSSRLLYKAITV